MTDGQCWALCTWNIFIVNRLITSDVFHAFCPHLNTVLETETFWKTPPREKIFKPSEHHFSHVCTDVQSLSESIDEQRRHCYAIGHRASRQRPRFLTGLHLTFFWTSRMFMEDSFLSKERRHDTSAPASSSVPVQQFMWRTSWLHRADRSLRWSDGNSSCFCWSDLDANFATERVSQVLFPPQNSVLCCLKYNFNLVSLCLSV